MHDWMHYQEIVLVKSFFLSFHLIFPTMLKHLSLNCVLCGITLPLVLCILHPHLHLDCYLLSSYFEGCSLHPNLFSFSSKDLFLSAVQKRNQTNQCKKMLLPFSSKNIFLLNLNVHCSSEKNGSCVGCSPKHVQQILDFCNYLIVDRN